MYFIHRFLFVFLAGLRTVEAFGSTARAFFNTPRINDKPKLILISGSPGTGKSTFGMAVALDQGILRCISTDTIRAVMRSFVGCEVSPALHRSSYAPAFEGDCAVRSWKESCSCLAPSVDELVQDAIDRKVSLVVEGVHVIPSKRLIDKWEEAGGCAIGVLLQIEKSEKHKAQLQRRGFTTGNMTNESKKINSYDRIRAIQDEMMRLAKESGWLQIEQRTEVDPLDIIAYGLDGQEVNGVAECDYFVSEEENLEENVENLVDNIMEENVDNLMDNIMVETAEKKDAFEI